LMDLHMLNNRMNEQRSHIINAPFVLVRELEKHHVDNSR
jgi:hypothetical protein